MKQHFPKAISLAVAMASVSGLAHAQLEEVIITAQKRSESLQDVPIAVTALTGEDMSAANVDGQMSLPMVTPTLSFKRTSTFASPFLRGVGTEFANAGLESSVSVYLDDSYVPRVQSGLFSFTDTERVEVLKGPQGTLYGRNATGGAIRVITKDPVQEFEGKIAATVGDEDRKIIEGVVNLPVTDSVAVRLTGKYNEADGYIDNVSPNPSLDELHDFEETTITGKVLYDNGESLQVKLSADYSEIDGSVGFGFINLFDGAPQQAAAALGGCTTQEHQKICQDLGNDGQRPTPGTKTENFGGALRIDYDFDSATFSSITAYRGVDEDYAADLDSTDVLAQNIHGTPETDQFTQEFQLTSDGNGDLSYVLGFFYLQEEAEFDAFSVYGTAVEFLGGLPIGWGQAGAGQVDVTSWAPYAQVDYRFNDQWTLTLGLRYTDEEKELVFSELRVGEIGTDGQISSPAQVIEFEEDKTSFEEWTPKATLSWFATDELMVYATYANGFKSGGFNLPSFKQPEEVDPEDLQSFELGWKYEGSTVRFNGAAFYYDYQDLQTQFVDQETGGVSVQNAADAEIIGLEADLTWAPTENWDFGAGIGYLDATYKDFIGESYVPCVELPFGDPSCALYPLGLGLVTGDLSDNDLPQAPEVSGYVRASYFLDVNNIGGFRFNVIASYRDDAWFEASNTFDDPSRTLVNASIDWNSPSEMFFARVYANNLTDEDWDTAKAPQASGGWRIPAEPRQVFFQVGVNF